MRQLILMVAGALALAGCNIHAPASAGTLPPSTLPQSVTVDDQIGISVELAYQAASLAERTAVKAGFVSPTQAAHLAILDNQAYNAVCVVRTAYDVANGNDPTKRLDPCPVETKMNRAVGYVQAAQMAVEVIRSLVSATKQEGAAQ